LLAHLIHARQVGDDQHQAIEPDGERPQLEHIGQICIDKEHDQRDHEHSEGPGERVSHGRLAQDAPPVVGHVQERQDENIEHIAAQHVPYGEIAQATGQRAIQHQELGERGDRRNEQAPHEETSQARADTDHIAIPGQLQRSGHQHGGSSDELDPGHGY